MKPEEEKKNIKEEPIAQEIDESLGETQVVPEEQVSSLEDTPVVGSEKLDASSDQGSTVEKEPLQKTEDKESQEEEKTDPGEIKETVLALKEDESDQKKPEEFANDKENEESVQLPKCATFLIGRKIGMTRIFDKSGNNLPVTIINVSPNVVTQVKNQKSDGYSAIQVGMGDYNPKSLRKADKGKFEKLGLEFKTNLKEFRVSDAEVDDFSIGSILSVGVFKNGDIVHVTGVSQGKGFTGHMKRHGFHGGRRSHGKNSVMRKAGSVGASADPARIWPGKLMAGRSGGENNTIKNLTVVRVDSGNNNLYIKGAVPGANSGIVYVAA